MIILSSDSEDPLSEDDETLPVKCHEKTFNMKHERKTVKMFGPSSGGLNKGKQDNLSRKRESKKK